MAFNNKNGGNEEWSLAKLKKRIYRPGEEFEERGKEPRLHEYTQHAQKNWPAEISREEIEEALMTGSARPRSRILKIFIGAAVLLLAAGFAAFWYLLGGFGGISPKDISLTIEGPQELGGGDLAEWKVTIENRSDKAMEFADFVFHYPAGSRPVDKASQLISTLRERKELGRIAPNSRLEERFRAFVFGAQDEPIEAAASLEYRFEGSNVILGRDEKLVTRITRSPIVVSISAPDAVNSGDRFELKIEFISEAKDVLAGAMLEMEYPDNFTFVDASPKPGAGNSKWDLGDLKPGERRTYAIKGVLNSQEHAQETFRVFVGVFAGTGRTVYGSDTATVSLAQQFLDIQLKSASDVLLPGQGVVIDVFWKNNLPVAVENTTVKIGLAGRGYDAQTLKSEGGSFVFSENAMRWNPASYPAFAFIEPGEEGVLRLNFTVPKFFDIRSVNDKNFSVKLTGSFSVPVNPVGFEEVDISGESSMELKIATETQFLREGYYRLQAMPGSGPIPPKVGAETVYTVVWSLTNSTNDVKQGMVSATLPQYMSWKGVVSPSDEKIAYNNLTGKIEWKFDLLRSGTGLIRSAREVMFQVVLIPAPPDIGKSPVIISEATAQGIDDFTGGEMRVSAPALTTDLHSEPQFKGGDGQVIP